MPVYFVYRCHYGSPCEKHIRRFEYDTVLDWAKAVFKQFDMMDDAYQYAEDLLGGLYVYSFGSMFEIDEEEGPRKPPRTMADVKDWFTAMYEQESAHGPHHIQILTDDDEIEMAVYVFDNHYRKKHPGKADFLLHDGWELPGGDSDKPLPKLPKTERLKPNGGGEGTLFAVSLYADCSSNLEDLAPANRIDGLRVPDLAHYLLTHPETDADDDLGLFDIGLREIRGNLQELLKKPKGPDKGFLVAIRDHPDDLTIWGAYSDWLEDHDLPPAGLHLLELALKARYLSDAHKHRNPKFDCVKVTPHMAQASKNEGRWPDKPARKITDRDTFRQFIFFDDRWAAAHPVLATNILTFASRWDVLT